MKKFALPLLSTVILCFHLQCAGPQVEENITRDNNLPEVSPDLQALENEIVRAEDSLPLRKDNEARIRWYGGKKQKTEYVVLYLHGYAGSYRDGYPLNVMFAERYGANIYMARMAGHGMQAEHSMDGFTAQNAYEKARRDLAYAQRLGEKVIILSTSTGGTLGLTLAANFPDQVHALINLSPNIKDEQIGAGLLNTAIGDELAKVVFMGDERHISYEEDSAALYWDTIYPVQALVELQSLLESTMLTQTFEKVKCPVLTLYYYENIFKKDRRVDVDEYEDVYEVLGTPQDQRRLIPLESPKSHFIGSSIKSKDYRVALEKIDAFCREVLGMNPVVDQ